MREKLRRKNSGCLLLKLLLSHLLIVLDNYSWYQIKTETYYVIPSVRQMNLLTIVFMNIDENYRKLKKNRKRIIKVVS